MSVLFAIAFCCNSCLCLSLAVSNCLRFSSTFFSLSSNAFRYSCNVISAAVFVCSIFFSASFRFSDAILYRSACFFNMNSLLS